MRWLLFLCVLIWIWSLAAWGKEEKKIFQFGCAYFDGITIGLLCMEVLPMAFGESFFG